MISIFLYPIIEYIRPLLDGIRSLVRQLDSPTVLLRQHEYDMRGISIFLLFSFKLTEETLKHIPFKVIKTT